jgi:hypothetical protein
VKLEAEAYPWGFPTYFRAVRGNRLVVKNINIRRCVIEISRVNYCQFYSQAGGEQRASIPNT